MVYGVWCVCVYFVSVYVCVVERDQESVSSLLIGFPIFLHIEREFGMGFRIGHVHFWLTFHFFMSGDLMPPLNISLQSVSRGLGTSIPFSSCFAAFLWPVCELFCLPTNRFFEVIKAKNQKIEFIVSLFPTSAHFLMALQTCLRTKFSYLGYYFDLRNTY